MHTLLRITPTLLGLMALVWLTGCVSTQKRYDKAQDLEAQGRHAEAAEYYIKVLEKEPDWEGGSERLREAGNQALLLLFDEADAARLDGDYDEALRRIDQFEALRDAARSVGVTLDVPADYAAFRDAVTESAIAAFIAEAERAERAGDWNDALAAYEKATAYTTNPDQRDDLVRRQADVHLRWAEYDFDREYYRAGFDHAQHALDLVGPDHPLAEHAVAMQATALEAGTRAIAFLPFWPTPSVRQKGRKAT